MFSVLVSRLFICNSILFSRFWIIFTTIILNSFSGRLPISSSFVWFGGLLSCSFTCGVFLFLFILFRLLCLGWPFRMLEVCYSSLLWRFLPVGGVGWVACQGFLVREAWVSVQCVELDLFSLECSDVSSSEFWRVYGFGVTFVLRVMFLCCGRIRVVYLAVELIGSWVELGFSVGMEAFGWALVD